MALIVDIPHDRGIIYLQQYVRVDNVNTDKTNMQILAGIYQTKEAAENAPPHMAVNLYGEFDLYSSLNLWEQAYVYLKQRWPDAVDA